MKTIKMKKESLPWFKQWIDSVIECEKDAVRVFGDDPYKNYLKYAKDIKNQLTKKKKEIKADMGIDC